MKKDKTGDRSSAAELRRRAEERLSRQSAAPESLRSGEETARLLHELEVYQIELELQNTELRSSRDDVERLLEIYTDLYDFAPVGYFSVDSQGIILSANLTYAGMLGLVRSRLIGQRMAKFVDAAFRQDFALFLDSAFSCRGKEVFETLLLREKQPPLFAHIEAIAFKTGQECRLAVIDITERQLAKLALEAKRQELEKNNQCLQELLDELHRKERLLIQQSRHAALGEMIGNIAHQWRQPLNTLGLLVQRLQYLYGSDVFTREFVETSVTSAMTHIQYMSHTIDDFRNFFSNEQVKKEFRVIEAVDSALTLVEASFKERRINITRKGREDVIIVGYANEYAQVLLNILLNAKDAITERNIALPHLEITVTAEDNKSVVTIADNAGGIAEDILEKIFDPYFSTKGPQQGTGIGLFMSKSIIENNMGGRLSVRNIDGGAEFRIEV